MSVNSLPSFAQAFSNHSLSSISGNNALPPIMQQGRKRINDDHIRVKDESPEPDDDAAPPPSSLMPSPLKKRRVTVSGTAPHPLHIDVRPAPDQSISTPISPVVMGFTVQRDNPGAIEQVRSTFSIKQKQQALIEQRRGSAAGIMSPTVSDDHQRQMPPQPPPPAQAPTPRTARRSPNMNPATRRQRAASPQPTPMQVQQQQAIQQQQQQQQPPQNSLPPPPISFARRRAALLGGKKKPADIVISPREAHTRDQFQPSIQSAPPVPQAGGQNQFYSGRFQMALPRLPNLTPGTDSIRRVPGNVPPTPTRLSLLQNPPLVQNRSPPAPSVPISSSLVPPTPTSFTRPGMYQGDKAAFLQPFELFYEALNDSKQLKNWLGDQLHKSQSLMQNLTQQQERINETVESLVEKRVSGIKSEMTALRRRVEDLEEALRSGHRRASMDLGGSVPAIHNNNKGLQNGVPSGSVAPESYSFPPVSAQDAAASGSARLTVRPEPTRRLSSPGWGQDRQHASGSENNGSGSPVPFDARRVSTSATRHEPPPPSSSTSRPKQSPPQVYRDGPKHIVHPPTPPTQARAAVEGRPQPPPLTRQGSSHSTGVPMVMISGERERDGQSTATTRRAGSRRNSVVMSPPEVES
ncbi:hypothetical protein GALMADRAFT_220699 [Galerina marginata CBS 339.88]|uniref:Uncharacterized protein n=1 Tax=Galerina marginata (strain CBS 339.88) TaxID=685588 RepID=A0A067TK39_GALM3|nr:hypothetical protein GALMADRAFT_220699 [Galerina marginata CBS 339.88]